jgi:hypothetical protein
MLLASIAIGLLGGGLVLDGRLRAADGPFLRGDANADGAVDIADPIFIIGWLLKGGSLPPCLDAADVDDSGRLDIGDAIRLIDFLFRAGSPPPPPYPACGPDPTGDALTCLEHSACRPPARSVTLSWEAPATRADGRPLLDLAGFKVHIGALPGVYTREEEAGIATSFTVGELEPGTYHFAVSAYDAAGNVSELSAPVSATLE